MIVNVKCPKCNHTEPVDVDLGVRGGDQNHINIEPDITDDNMADLCVRFKEHITTHAQ